MFSYSIIRVHAMDSYVAAQAREVLFARLVILAIICIAHLCKKKPKRLQHRETRPSPQVQTRRRRIWSRDWLLRRPMHGDYHQLLQELNREDPNGFKNFLRIKPELFQEMVVG